MGRSSPRRGDRDRPDAPPRGVGEVIRQLLSERPLRGGVTLGRLVRGWEGIVGAQLARETAPARLDDGVLVVAASSPAWAAQVRFLTQEIRRRANDALGAEEIRSVRVVVGEVGSKASRRGLGSRPRSGRDGGR